MSWQRVFYFPLKSKLEALLRVPVYRDMLEHEYSRPRHRHLISDVYDAPAWQNFLGPCVSPNNRIGLQFCVDGIPAFAANTLSLKPAEFVNLSLPPTERGKVENILLLMLLPSSMKGDQSKKYYDFASRYELQDLFDNGKFLFFTIILHFNVISTRMQVSAGSKCASSVHLWTPRVAQNYWVS